MKNVKRSAVGPDPNPGKEAPPCKCLIAISYASEIEEIAARLDRGLVELLGGAADQVFFALRSPVLNASEEEVKQQLRAVYEQARIVVLLWSVDYERSKFTEVEKLTCAESLLDKVTHQPSRPVKGQPYIYTVAVTDPGATPKIPFDAFLSGRRRQPLWRVAEDIINRLDAMQGSSFALQRNRDRALLRWDLPAYRALQGTAMQSDCTHMFDCHRAFAASCETGELHCLAASVAAQLIKLAIQAQAAGLASEGTKPSRTQNGVFAFINLSQECKALLRIFAARHEHLQAMVGERGGAAVKGVHVPFGRICKDLDVHQAERMRDFLNKHLPMLDEETARCFCETVLNVARCHSPGLWQPQCMNEAANTLVSWSMDIAGFLTDLSLEGKSMLQMGRLSQSPPSAAKTYADEAKANLVFLV